MSTIVVLLTLLVLLQIAAGFYLELKPAARSPVSARRIKTGLGINLLLMIGGIMLMAFSGLQEVMAATGMEAGGREISVGLGLALIGIGLPTGLATIAAGIAVSSVGAASLAVIAEKPDMFGRTLIYLGLAEGIAIYGLVVTILLLGKI
jgi:V/A-type H+-transporting ATPase subunit K